MPSLDDPLAIGDLQLDNRLYRAPLLECAGNGPDAVETLINELRPAAEAGAGLIFQGATIVRGEGGCAAPGMTRVHDPTFVSDLTALTDAIHDAGGRIAIQLEYGGLRSMETWHAGYREAHPETDQLAVSSPPRLLRALDRAGVLSLSPQVMSTEEVYELAADFGAAAGYAVDAGYDAIHLAGANMGIIQQFLSPYYNRRDDEFGGSLADRTRFLELVHDEIRNRAGDVPLLTKIPAETAAPRAIRRRLSRSDGVEIARRLDDIGYDALVPVETSVFWDMSIVRGAYPKRAWNDDRFEAEYAEAFGSPYRTRLVALLNRLQSRRFGHEPGWNEAFCRSVRDSVGVPVLLEGGVRDREQIDRLLRSGACDAVGIGRPFYAEPRLPALLLDESGPDRVACESCNNCAVPQASGADGVCRTPAVMAEQGERRAAGVYGRAERR